MEQRYILHRNPIVYSISHAQKFFLVTPSSSTLHAYLTKKNYLLNFSTHNEKDSRKSSFSTTLSSHESRIFEFFPV